MNNYVAFLRAVNVGGTGKLPMSDLKAMCTEIGFANIRTYIASGNVVFSWDGPADTAKASLEARLAAYAGKQVGVAIRNGPEMDHVLARNPFADADPRFVLTTFLDRPPPDDAAVAATGLVDEDIAINGREIYVHYPNGQSRSKLHIPAAKEGTARNQNTVAKMVAWLRDETG